MNAQIEGAKTLMLKLLANGPQPTTVVRQAVLDAGFKKYHVSMAICELNLGRTRNGGGRNGVLCYVRPMTRDELEAQLDGMFAQEREDIRATSTHKIVKQLIEVYEKCRDVHTLAVALRKAIIALQTR